MEHKHPSIHANFRLGILYDLLLSEFGTAEVLHFRFELAQLYAYAQNKAFATTLISKISYNSGRTMSA